jgi:lysozyme
VEINMPRKINRAGIALIKHFESLQLTAYLDPVGIWTIGYGHTEGVQPGTTITVAQANRFLSADLTPAEMAVQSGICDAPTTSDQFSAMVSLCFNIGAGNFAESTVLREHVAGHHEAAANAFLLWNKGTVDGALVVLPGLTLRREAERRLYLNLPAPS